MIDESMDKEAMKQPPKEWEFRSKPAWQRLIIMLGGVTMNVLVAFVIYAFVLMIWGDKKDSYKFFKIWDHAQPIVLMNEIGFQNGDKIVSINGEPVDYFENLPAKIILGATIIVERNGQPVTLNLPVNLIEKLIESKRKKGLLLTPRIPSYVGAYDKKAKQDTLNGYKAGLLEMDRIVAIDSTPIQFYDEMSSVLQKHKNEEVDTVR